ncbi:MAG: RpoL/Rpb11 RNA polymerase subunit family protein [Thermoplasmata archaeon]
MELNLVSKEKKLVVIEFTDVKETIVHPLIDKLINDKDVLLAAYKTGHPQLDKPILTVRTQRVNPETAVKNAADRLAEEIKFLKKEFEKAIKSPKVKKAEVKKPKATKAKKSAPKKTKTSKPKKGGTKKTKST